MGLIDEVLSENSLVDEVMSEGGSLIDNVLSEQQPKTAQQIIQQEPAQLPPRPSTPAQQPQVPVQGKPRFLQMGTGEGDPYGFISAAETGRMQKQTLLKEEEGSKLGQPKFSPVGEMTEEDVRNVVEKKKNPITNFLLSNASGVNNLAAGVLLLPEISFRSVNPVADFYKKSSDEFKKSAQGRRIAEQLQTMNEALDKPDILKDGAKGLRKNAEWLSDHTVFDKGIWESFRQKDFAGGGEQLAYAFAENMPQLIGMGLSLYAGAPGASLGALGASAAGNKYLDLEGQDLTPEEKARRAAMTGLIEVAAERVGTLGVWKKLLSNNVARNLFKNGFARGAFNLATILGAEPTEEVGTQMANNFVDAVYGVTHPDGTPVGLFDGVADAALVAIPFSAGAGGIIGARSLKKRRMFGPIAEEDIERARNILAVPTEEIQAEPTPEIYAPEVLEGEELRQRMEEEFDREPAVGDSVRVSIIPEGKKKPRHFNATILDYSEKADQYKVKINKYFGSEAGKLYDVGQEVWIPKKELEGISVTPQQRAGRVARVEREGLTREQSERQRQRSKEFTGLAYDYSQSEQIESAGTGRAAGLAISEGRRRALEEWGQRIGVPEVATSERARAENLDKLKAEIFGSERAAEQKTLSDAEKISNEGYRGFNNIEDDLNFRAVHDPVTGKWDIFNKTTGENVFPEEQFGSPDFGFYDAKRLHPEQYPGESDKAGTESETEFDTEVYDIVNTYKDNLPALEETAKSQGIDTEGKSPEQYTREMLDKWNDPKELEPLPTQKEAETFTPPPQRVGNTEQRSGDVAAGGLAYGMDLPKYAGNINLERIDAGYDPKKMITDISGYYRGKIDEARRGVISNEMTRAMADQLGMTPEQLLRKRKGRAFNAEEALAARDILVQSATDLYNLQKTAIETGTDKALADFRLAMERHACIQAQVAGITAEAGRALQAFRIKAKDAETLRIAKNYKAMLDALGGREINQSIADVLGGIDPSDQVAVNRFIAEATHVTTMDKLYELWINGLLSAPTTHLANLFSNTLATAANLGIERPLGAIADAARSIFKGKRKVFFGETPRAILGVITGIRRGLQKAGQAWLTGMPTDMNSKIEDVRIKAIKGRKGEIVRIPGRLLIAADELAKSINYESRIHALAYRYARQLGKHDFADNYARLLANPTDKMKADAAREARIRTFTEPLGKVGRMATSLRNSHPIFKILFPFVTTPTNIAKYGLKRTPLGFIDTYMKFKRGELSTDNIAAIEEDIAAPLMGSIVFFAVYNLISSGLLTGGGPTDKDKRRTLRNSGWQPYSVKIGDKYYSYERLEPIGSVVGMAADFAEISEKSEDYENLGTAVIQSFAKNIASKTFLQGVTDVINALSDPDRYGDKYVQRFLTSVVPSFVRRAASAVDPTLRKTENVKEAFQSRLPYLSKALLPRRDIFGREIEYEGNIFSRFILPIGISTESKDPVDKELIRLKIYPNMPSDRVSGEKLTPEQYDQYAKESGEMAHKILIDYAGVGKKRWERLPDFIKEDIIKNSIRSARDFTRKRLFFDLSVEAAKKDVQKIKDDIDGSMK